MKQWDWEEAGKHNRPEKLAWLQENWDKSISLEEYMAAMKKIKPTQNEPSRMKKDYHNLKYNFGFFV